MFATIQDFMEFVEKNDVMTVNFLMLDLAGKLHTLTAPARSLDEDTLREGFGFDGSSYGYVTVEKSDMVFIPDVTTTFVDPFSEDLKLNVFVKVISLGDEETRFDQDPRFIAEKVEKYAASLGISDDIILGPEYEFYVFNGVRFENRPNSCGFEINSSESVSFCGESNNSGYQHRNGYHAAPPADTTMAFRDSLVMMMEESGFPVKYHHHEVGGAGQLEIEVKMGNLLKMADTTIATKYLTKNLAVEHGLTATFMPKPLYGEAGSGMHVHIMLKKGSENVFYEKGGYCDLSRSAEYFIGGLLTHAPAVLAFSNPTSNSYRRLVKGYEAPVSIVYGKSNRTSAVRIPGYTTGAHDKRIEFRTQDATCNPYFSFAAIMMAGIDGINRKIDPREQGFGPIDGINVFDLPEAQRGKIKSLPTSLPEAVKALEEDYQFLLEGGVFSEILVKTWIKHLRKTHIDPIALRPHPYEFELSYDC
ncbi:MAG: type I glutamate--ammonia ligase [Candidatus Wallbacteria bacterium HGW-Wallbacteria-1]|uniref:Type I glutamate--ammonia ligase n=1 Tax=Candidatus Wallbacteria bacterium HGW-Wallbacteria-1 TaxID=2013854 RepID=A0A2N1PQG3_9BACT|nr:MAG: type I glutamate--ammonia ligase [Candidatus Wallbacteria bacterium HGW-Wallbacteria-1]